MCVLQSPGSMCHLVGVVVQSYNGFPLLYARQYYHQSSVSHHQVQVVPGQVKVHCLAGDTNTNADYIYLHNIWSGDNSSKCNSLKGR